MVAIERAAGVPDEEAPQLLRGETMKNFWQGPNVSNKLRAELEKAALDVAKARHAATGAPVMLSLELEYFGFNARRDPSIRRQGEYNNFIRIVDETRPRRLGKGDGRGKHKKSNSSIKLGKSAPKASQPSPARIPSVATNIPQRWIAVPPKTDSRAKVPCAAT
jgi:hypothetical protein